jgi:hypothetical protein
MRLQPVPSFPVAHSRRRELLGLLDHHSHFESDTPSQPKQREEPPQSSASDHHLLRCCCTTVMFWTTSCAAPEHFADEGALKQFTLREQQSQEARLSD